jgi:polysaccharide biosynthesis transport protein
MATDSMIVKTSNGSLQQADSSQYGAPAYAYVRPDLNQTGGVAWREILRVLRKHRRIWLAFALAVEIAVALIVFSLAYTYEARATLDIEPPSQTVGFQNDSSGATPSQADYVQTQTEILEGDGLALNVIAALHLDQNPVFLKRNWFQKLLSGATAIFSRTETGHGADTERLLDTYRAGLSVSQVTDSRLLEVRYESRDPQLSAQIVNTAVQQYLEQAHRSKYEATLRAADALAPELTDLQSSATKLNQAVLDFQKTHEGVELGSQTAAGDAGGATSGSAASANPVAARVGELNQQLTQAIADKLQQESYMKLIEQGNNDALPQMKDSIVIQQLTTSLADSRAQLAQALAVYGGNNPQVRKLQEQSLVLTNQLDGERARIVNEIKAAYASAENRERLIRNTLGEMKGKLDQSNANVMQYDTLKRQADANSNLYVSLSSQIKQMAMAGSLNSNNIRVLDDARVPERPSGPHRFRILGAGAAFALLGGMVLAFAAESMDDTISSIDDLKRWSGLPALALVPKVGALNTRFSRQHRAALPKSVLTLQAHGMKYLAEFPNSPEAEAIRNLETVIRLPATPGARPVQTVLITSAFAGEGKTTVAANLAMTLARHGKTCLVDADLRHPAITHAFGLSRQAGLQDLLTGPERPVQEVCRALPEFPNLTVVGTGTKHPSGQEALTSNRMRNLAEQLRANYEYVIFDSPPIIPFSEARWLSTLSDGAVLVTRCSETTRRAMMWSLEILEGLRAPVLGLVLNGVNLQAEYYFYGMKDGYGSKAAYDVAER